VVNLFALAGWIFYLLWVFTLLLKIWAVADAATRPAEAFVAGNKMTKTGWLIILGLALLVAFLFQQPFTLLNLAGTIAAIVYLVDVRPVLRSLTRRR
jgi:hypothetical protein